MPAARFRPLALSTAEHEAAHCVVALAQGIRVHAVRIRRAGRRDPITEHESFRDHRGRLSNVDHGERVRWFVLMSMAGPAIEYVLTQNPAYYERECGDDWDTIHELLRLRPHQLTQEELWDAACELVTANRGAIGELAMRLMQHGEVSGADATQIVSSSVKNPSI